MFAIIRLYHLSPIFEESFKSDWSSLVYAFRAHDAFVAARLHKESPVTFIAYERWKSKESYLEVMNDYEGKIREPLEKLKANCNDIKLLHSMDMIEAHAIDGQ